MKIQDIPTSILSTELSRRKTVIKSFRKSELQIMRFLVENKDKLQLPYREMIPFLPKPSSTSIFPRLFHNLYLLGIININGQKREWVNFEKLKHLLDKYLS